VKLELLAPAAGFVVGIDPLEIGLSAVAMGAGRTRADQAVDPAVGIELLAKRGERVAKGAPIARLHVRTAESAAQVTDRVQRAFRIGARAPRAIPLVLGKVARDTTRARGPA
jgi:pyrimidine-nucleoside phosphorylase